MLLAGDIGGTKTMLAVFAPRLGVHTPIVSATFTSGRYSSLGAMVQEFLATHPVTVEQASFGVAGPVVGGQARITNLPWLLDQAELQATFGLSSVRLLNDLDAIAHAVPHLRPDDLYSLAIGQPTSGGTIAVIAPGTGLGEAYLAWVGGQYVPFASEGGHADFAPIGTLQIELLRFLEDRFGHVSYERVCSGRGLPNVYAFLHAQGVAEEPQWLAEQLASAGDPTPVIVNAALDVERPCPLCRATLDLFVSILGAEAGNLALKVLATGGVYLGGGIPPRILPALSSGRFLAAFRAKGRFAGLLERMPIHVIRHPNVALLGAAVHGFEASTHGSTV